MASDLKGIYNRLKKNRGIVEGFKRTNALERKRQEERALADFLAKDPKLQKKYGDVLPAMEKLYEGRKTTQLVDSRLGRLARNSDWYSLASDLYRWAVEREKPDMKRDRGYQERDRANALPQSADVADQPGPGGGPRALQGRPRRDCWTCRRTRRSPRSRASSRGRPGPARDGGDRRLREATSTRARRSAAWTTGSACSR